MPRVTHVKKAAKDNNCVKAGESYYWWKFRYGGKHRSKTYPRPSQLTQSNYLGQLYGFQERVEDFEVTDRDDVVADLEEIKDDIQNLGEEQNEKRDNMPESLYDSSTGELLGERAEACEEMVTSLEDGRAR
jgi:hypothetical protein